MCGEKIGAGTVEFFAAGGQQSQVVGEVAWLDAVAKGDHHGSERSFVIAGAAAEDFAVVVLSGEWFDGHVPDIYRVQVGAKQQGFVGVLSRSYGQDIWAVGCGGLDLSVQVVFV